MSGHSKWDTIKHKKAANDAKKGKVFSKLSVQITHAARQGGGDPEMNPNLRLYIDKAKTVGFPLDRIEKAVQKGTGEGGEGIIFEEITYEGFGPSGIQLIVDVITDNKNRTIADIRQIFESIGGHIGDSGSVSWNFDTKGYIVIKCGHMEKNPKFGGEDIFVEENREEVMLKLMDIDGVLDIQDTQEGYEIYTEYSKFASVRDAIKKLNYVMEESEIIKVPKMYKKLEGEELTKAENAIERLEDLDDVQNVWTDLEY